MNSEQFAFLDNLEIDVKHEYFELKQKLDELRISLKSEVTPGEDCRDAQFSQSDCLTKCERLFEALHSSLRRESEAKIESQILESKLASNNLRIDQLSKISNSDNESQNFLKREIEAIQEELDETYERERRHKEVCEKLKIEIDHLSANLEESYAKEAQSERQIQIITEKCERVLNEKEKLSQQLLEGKKDLEDLLIEKSNIDNVHSEIESEIALYKEKIRELKLRCSSEQSRSEEMQRVVEDKEEECSEKERQLDALRKTNDGLKAELDEANKEFVEKRKQQTKLENENNEVKKRSGEMEKRVNEQKSTISDLKTIIEESKADNEAKISALQILEKNYANLVLSKDQMRLRMDSLIEEKQKVETDKLNLEKSIASLNKELETMSKNLESEKKNYAEAVRERNILSKNLIKASSGSQKQNQLLSLHENSKKSLEVEIQKLREETQKQRKLIASLDREKEHYISEASDLANKIMLYVMQNKDKDADLAQFKKQIDDFESKLQQQRNLYETARSDCNTSNKSLIEVQEQIAKNKKESSVLQQQCEALKEEIVNAEVQLAREKNDRQKAERTRESLRNEVNLAKNKVEELQSLIEEERDQKIRLETKISELERNLLDLNRDNAKLTSAKELFSIQLLRKTREVELLCEKIDIQSTILARGENKYKQRVEEVKSLKTEIKKLSNELNSAIKLNGNINEEQRKVKILEEKLESEKSALKAAQYAAETPLNVHRWRKLQCEDPERYELIKRTQCLQRLIIQKSKQVELSNRAKAESEKNLKELQKRNSNLPGPEIVLQCREMQNNLKYKTDSIKALQTENVVLHTEIENLKLKIESLNEDLIEVIEAKNQEKVFTTQSKKCNQNVDQLGGTKSKKLPDKNFVMCGKKVGKFGKKWMPDSAQI